jgi:hypothetical protein
LFPLLAPEPIATLFLCPFSLLFPQLGGLVFGGSGSGRGGVRRRLGDDGGLVHGDEFVVALTSSRYVSFRDGLQVGQQGLEFKRAGYKQSE